MTVITRFAPSPTGFLHIGGARTALFSYLFAKRHEGKFLLRIEDTDKKRSTQEAIDAILESMEWLGLTPDEEVVYQSSREARHKQAAEEMIARSNAYYCYCSPEAVEAMREKARAEGKPMQYDGTCRERHPSTAPQGVSPVVRLKSPMTGETIVNDAVQGDVRFGNDQMDDLVLLRADGTPTYMLAVVVDDHDMGITHIIRGDDHLTNAGRQILIYQAMGWDVPVFAHIPLIHGPDGAKLSKRHGALGAEAYRDMGYLPEAVNNYLLRLGWSHGDDEIITREQAIAWFDLEHIGKSPARFDIKKLDHINGHYINQADNTRLAELILPLISERTQQQINATGKARLIAGIAGLKPRAKTLLDLVESAAFYAVHDALPLTEQAQNHLNKIGYSLLPEFLPILEAEKSWETPALDAHIKAFIEAKQIKMPELAMSLRAAITYSTNSPSVSEVMVVLGKEETLARIKGCMQGEQGKKRA
jgi:glutamyl-tRNA synthetase